MTTPTVAGSVIVVAGCIGVGKSTLVRQLLGEPRSFDGTWTIGANAVALGPYDDHLRYPGPDAWREVSTWALPPMLDVIASLAHAQLDHPAAELRHGDARSAGPCDDQTRIGAE